MCQALFWVLRRNTHTLKTQTEIPADHHRGYIHGWYNTVSLNKMFYFYVLNNSSDVITKDHSSK